MASTPITTSTAQPITRAKSFSNATLATAITAANDFIAGLEADTTKTYSSDFKSFEWDGTSFNVCIQYSYTIITPLDPGV